jgi:hypothetical protein
MGQNLYPEIIDTILREMLTGVFTLFRAGCVGIVAINLIPEGRAVVTPPMAHWIATVVKHSSHI